MGVKTYTVVRGKYSFQVSLYDADSGELLCYTQANRLGQLRTGATTGVAVKHLANPGASALAIIGTGYQASTQLEAVCKVRNIQRIKAYSRNRDNRESFAKTMTDSLGIEVVAAEVNQETVAGCDIVVCIAATMEPVLEGEWLAQGSTIVAAGPTTWRAREVDDATLNRSDRVFVDSLEQARTEAGDMASAVDRGIFSMEPGFGVTPRGGRNGQRAGNQGPDHLRQAHGHRRSRCRRRQAGLRQSQSGGSGHGDGLVGGQAEFR